MPFKKAYNYLKYLLFWIKGILLAPHGDDHHLIWENPYSNFFFILGASILFSFFSLFAIPSFAFLVGFTINPLMAPVAIILTFIFTCLLSFYFYPKNFLLPTLAILFVIVAISCYSLFIAGRFYDLSYDGQAYHQDAIILLKQGWNPVYKELSRGDSMYNQLLNYYPKASEVVQATIFSFTRKIEFSKATNFLAMFMAAFFSMSFFLRFKKGSLLDSIFFTLILIVNPVSIFESLSFYIDSTLYYFFLSLVVSLIFMFTSKKLYPLIAVIMSSIVFVNLKTTALAYAVVILAIFHVFFWYNEKIKLSMKLFVVSLISLGLAVFIFGFNPYVTNTFRYGNPIYPTFGKNKIDFVLVNAPKNFLSVNSPIRLILSIFSKSEGLRHGTGYSKLKTPFTFTDKELQSFAFGTNTVGGFGVIFGGVFLITLLALFLLFLRGKNNPNFKYLLAAEALIIASVLINPASFYARFVPQLWLVPGLIVIYCLLHYSRFIRFFGFLIWGALILNSFLISKVYFTYNFQKSVVLKNTLYEYARETKNRKMEVSFGVFPANSVRFNEAGINFIGMKTLDCNYKKKFLTNVLPEANMQACIN